MAELPTIPAEYESPMGDLASELRDERPDFCPEWLWATLSETERDQYVMGQILMLDSDSLSDVAPLAWAASTYGTYPAEAGDIAIKDHEAVRDALVAIELAYAEYGYTTSRHRARDLFDGLCDLHTELVMAATRKAV